MSPIVTAGFPAPGPLAAAAVELLVDDALELLDDELLLPHAARPATRAAADSSAPALRPIDRLQRVCGLSRLLI
ncbi:MAG TPA: hypothetical protein VHS26_03470 [Solirubrobacteraceae bacterium]|nr:hypothetical protein [Solirubrobacteraceae bacterium]